MSSGFNKHGEFYMEYASDGAIRCIADLAKVDGLFLLAGAAMLAPTAIPLTLGIGAAGYLFGAAAQALNTRRVTTSHTGVRIDANVGERFVRALNPLNL